VKGRFPINETKEFFEKFKNDMEKMKSLTGNAVSGFMTLFSKVMGEGALSVREKELVALGISLAIRCEPCIRLHVQKCLAAGATKEQLFEAAEVAVMMGGGPAFTHLGVVIETVQSLGN